MDPNLAAAIALLIGASAFFVRMVTPAIVRLIDAGAARISRDTEKKKDDAQ
ncbi:hypothetical protein KGZ16_30155 [Pseudomonas aeruginosa]|nr:hypothetical protein [Pseudomonas aeruginosa]